MEKIIFDDGVKEFVINGDESRILRFNPTDMNFIANAQACVQKLNDLQKNLEQKNIDLDSNGEPTDGLEESAAIVDEVRNAYVEAFDELFYPGASEIIFQHTSPLAMANGKPVAKNFLESFQKVIKPYIEKEAKKSEKNIGKYKEAYDRVSSSLS